MAGRYVEVVQAIKTPLKYQTRTILNPWDHPG
jgi:hypothetical protein